MKKISSSPAGGPATINGIVYQLLWSLLRGIQIRVEKTDLAPDATSGTNATLVLEPIGGGGDVQEDSPAGRRIQQLKVGGHPWSLQDFVRDVLPDLYLAVDRNRSDDSYEFVTEGWMGGWKAVYDFFTTLRAQECPAMNPLGGLDNTDTVRFNHQKTGKKPFWDAETYTQRTLFARMARSLQEDNPAIRDLKQDADTLYRNLWHLLGRFTFIGNQEASILQDKVDRLLLEIVPTNTELAVKRDALLFNLARRASQGGARIDPSTFFAENGLPAVPLSHWTEILKNAANALKRQVRILKYDPDEDVRTAETPATWPLQTPLLAVVGESGQGKSWWLYNLALSLVETNPVVLISSNNDAERDMRAAARAFLNCANQDVELSLERVAARLKSIESPRHNLWLYLLIDGVHDVEAARQLAVQDWEYWGIVPIVAGSPDAMRAFSDTAHDRGATCEVGDFSVNQLQRYLTDGDTLAFYAIPGDIRDTLRRPLLARLYRDVTPESLFRPENEYELYALTLQEVFRIANTEERLAEAPIQRLALDVLEGAAYPWSSTQVETSGMTPRQLAFLLDRGLLQETANGMFRIWHDRLLNWIVAQAIVAAWCDGTKAAGFVVDSAARIWNAPYGGAERFLGYVPMDVFWLLARIGEKSQELLDALLTAMERVHPLEGETMYKELLPPLGEAIVPAIVRRMEALTAEDQWARIKPLAEGLAVFASSVTTPVCLRFLQSGVYSLLGAACEILQRRPDKAALESLWALLQDIQHNEEKYQKSDTSMAVAGWLEQDCFDALKSCAMLDPEWVEQAVLYQNVESDSLASLAYILPHLPDGQARCQRCQSRLQARLEPQHAGSVARMMYQFPDASGASWLRMQVPREEGLLGALSVQALTRVDASLALDALQELPELHLYTTRDWCMLPLLMKAPEAVRQRFLTMLRGSDAPIRLLDAFQGFEDELSSEHLDIALDALEQRLVAAPELNQLQHGDLWRPLDRICSANSLDALACLGRRRGSLLEQKLTEWMLLRSPRQGIWMDHLGQLGIDILYRMGGTGFTKVVNAWLRSGLHFGIIDGLKAAYKRPDAETIRLLREMATQNASDKDRGFQRYLAVEALALAEAWEPLVEATLACGFAIPRDVMYARLGASPLEDGVLAAAIQALSTREDQVTVGALLTIGMAQRQDFESLVVDIIEGSQPGSDTEEAGLLALSVLETQEERTARLVAARRKQAKLDPEHITITLINSRSDASNSLLQQSLTEAWDTRTAICLLNRDFATEQMLQGLHERLRSAVNGSPLSLHWDLDQITQDIDKAEHKQTLFTPDVTKVLREKAFTPEGAVRMGGAMESVIRGLAVADPDAAYLAAFRILEDVRSHDRENYPTLLIDIDSARAGEDLFEIMRVEKCAAVRAAIGRALRTHDIGARLKAWAEDPAPDRRIAACHIARYQEPTDDLHDLLSARLDDPDAEVFEIAAASLFKLRQARRQADLLAAMQGEAEAGQKWILLDAAIKVGDLGDEHATLWEGWSKTYQDSPYMIRQYIAEAMKAQREKIAKEDKSDR